MKAFWGKIHPKIKAVVFVGLLGTIVSVLNTVTEVYPNGWWSPIVLAALMALAGYQKRSSP